MMNSARTHAAELRPHLEQLGVAGFLTEVAPLLEPHATARHVLFAIERAPAELRVSADPARLRQVLINVVSSAAMLAGPGGTVRIWCESNDSLVAVRVRETARDHHAAARREHGSGFALSVSRELARAMGGDLKVLHHPERCSTFTLELRRVR